jgi:hypothetical protein
MGMPFGAAAAEAARLEDASGHPLRPLCLTSAAWSACLRGEFDESLRLNAEALAASSLADNDDKQALRVRSQTLTVSISVRMIQGATEQEVSGLVGEGLTVARMLGDPYYLAHALMQGMCVDSLEESLCLARSIENPSTLAYALALLAGEVIATDSARAKALVDEAITHAAAVRNQRAGALALQQLMQVLAEMGGDPVVAAQEALRSAQRLLDSGERLWGLSLLLNVATNLEALGARDPAVLVATWVLFQGFLPRPRSTSRLRSVEPVVALITDEVMLELASRVETMTDDEVLALCQAEIDHLR